MKTFTRVLTGLFISISLISAAQNAPVTICGNLDDCNSNVIIPVEVINFNDIGAVSLTLDYNYSMVQVTGVTAHASLPGFSADWTTVPGRLTMGWYGSSGVTLPDYSILVEISFTGLGAGDATDLEWFDVYGTNCEYAKYDGGEFNVLNDTPKEDYYFDGHLEYLRESPVTSAPQFVAPDQYQSVCMPFTVDQFTNIGAISLTLDYDPAVLTFQGFNSTAFPSGWENFQVTCPVPGRIIVGGTGPGFSLSDGSVLFNACFMYHCGTTDLTWWDGYSTACEYADGTSLTPLCDNPTSSFYINGRVTNGVNAPVTICGNVSDCNNNPVVPVQVINFRDIGAVSLTLEYDYSKVQVTGVAGNPALPGFSANWTANPGQLTMGWYGSAGVTLADYAVLADITFTGLESGDVTDLVWIENVPSTSCEYAKYDCGEYNVLNDSPQPDYYFNGHLEYLRPGPVTIAPDYIAPLNSDICIPITVNQFDNIGAISLTLDYDPDVLTYLNMTSSTVPGTWSDFQANVPVPGRLIVGGTGPGFSLPDGSVLFEACFHYNYDCGPTPPVTTPLNWNQDYSTSCEYADGTTLTPLCDNPASSYYINGQVTNALTANNDLNSTNEDVAVNGTVITNDILSCAGGEEWSLVGANGGASNGTVTMNLDGTYTYTPNPNYNGTDVFTYQICDAISICDQATVTITVLPVDEPDITPNITVEPSVMHGVTYFDIIVQVTELILTAPTNGLITVLIPQDVRWTLYGGYDGSATEINGKPVNNADWSYSSDASYHIFTTNSIIPAAGFSRFGFIAKWDGGATQGIYTITSQIPSWSGGEYRIDNNVDAEKLDYFY